MEKESMKILRDLPLAPFPLHPYTYRRELHVTDTDGFLPKLWFYYIGCSILRIYYMFFSTSTAQVRARSIPRQKPYLALFEVVKARQNSSILTLLVTLAYT